VTREKTGKTASLVAAALLLAAVGASCSHEAAKPTPKPGPPPPPPAPPLCVIDTTLNTDKPVKDRTYTPGYWFSLMLKGYTASGQISRPTTDCRAAVVMMDRDGCSTDPPAELLPAQLLTPNDMVVATVDDNHRLVWAMTDRLSDGEAQGPVALAELTQKGILMRALGVLRAYPQNVSLRLETMGGGGSVLVADGEHCERGEAGEECARAVRLVPLIGNKFAPTPLIDASGGCIGRPFIPVRYQGTAEGNGARYKGETLVTFSGGIVLVREQLALDTRPRHATDAASASYVTRVQADRQISLSDGKLIATGPSLLARWLSRQMAGLR